MAAPMSPNPSDKQMEVLFLLIAGIERFGAQFSQQELANFLGISKNAVHSRLRGLAARGYIELSKDTRERAITLRTVQFKAYQCFDKKPEIGEVEARFQELVGGKLVGTKDDVEREIAKIDARNANT